MKETIVISYDIKNSEDYDYEQLFEYFKSYGTWAVITESLWAIRTEKSLSDIRDELKEIVPKGSSLFITESSGIAAWSNVKCSNKWLKEYF